MSLPVCRFCKTLLEHTFVDLGMSPFSNSFIREEQLNQMEPFYPLHAWVCSSCFLVQLEEYERPERIFMDYSYFSSFSESWLRHASGFSAQATERFQLKGEHLVIEIASNDGYLLQYFVARGTPVLGIEPAENVARVAEKKGIPTLMKFFGTQTARELAASGRHADLLIANNVLAHVPDLKPGGTISVEFPHLLELIEHNQYDTIYHEHFSYFSFSTVVRIFRAHGLKVFDAEEIPTHGGSLRLYACHEGVDPRPIHPRLARLTERELAAGIRDLDTYSKFAERVRETKRALLEFLIGVKRRGKSIVGYGAPAKGNTLLNYCGIGKDFLDYTVDVSPHKQGHFLPGTHIPVFHPEMIRQTCPDYVLILPWNLRDEIVEQLADIRRWAGRFIIAIPKVEVVE
jgi:C-methyltransferase C-terminal domain/Putative zinc binding domain/Methyltransferase domain